MHKGAAAAHRRRKDAVERWGALYHRIALRFVKADPNAIGVPVPDDEYEEGVQALLPRLERCRSATDVHKELYAVLIEGMEWRVLGPPEAHNPLAVRVWADWERAHQARFGVTRP